MEILTFGVGGRIRECERILARRLSATPGRLILLPIPSSRDKKYITQSSYTIENICHVLEHGDYLVGYNLPAELLKFADQKKVKVYDGSLDEAFLGENAFLTAEGTLGYLLTHSKRDPSELSVGIIGYGRIGQRLLRLLLLFGSKITVFTGRKSVALELGEMGVSACLVGEKSDLSGLDILINTAPERQIDESDLPPELEIIDLASGNVFEPSDRLTKLASVPDAMYPLTAGRLYAEAAMDALFGDEK